MEVGIASFVTHISPGLDWPLSNPTHFSRRNVEIPYRSRQGNLFVKTADGGAGEGTRKSERHPVMGWIEVETSLHAKAGRRAHGISSHEE